MSKLISRRTLVLGAASTVFALPMINVSAQQGYDRYAAANWAINNAYGEYRFGNDCTFFVSQALWAGGVPQSREWTDKSTDWDLQAESRPYPGPTKTAALANAFVNHLVNKGLAYRGEITWSDNTASGADIGDIIAYDWYNNNDGSSSADSIIDHVAIVTGFDGAYPLVTQHSPSQVNRGWSWSINGNNWIEFAEPGSKAHLIHIAYFGELF